MPDLPKHFDARRDPAASERIRLLTADGLQWTVREIPAPTFDRRGGTHLVFGSDTIMRRLRSYPANWYEMSDSDLYALTRRIDPRS